MTLGRLDPVFRPRSVAVVGAGRERGGIGRQILDNLLAFGFTGPVYPVHPVARAVGGIRAYPSVRDLPEPVDLAVVAVPADKVPGLVEECGQAGVKGLVIVSAGFREAGPAGARREEALKAALDKWRIPAIGPNCMGILNTHPDVRLNATFSPARVRRGKVAFVSQSGALGLAILEQADRLGLGLSCFVSLGNKTDTSTNDLLEAWEDDPDVGLVLLYLENFGNPRRFVELARRVGRRKPIVAVKSGRTLAGARAARSHTGALAEKDAATEALFEQCGVLRARTIGELFDYAQAFAHAPEPAGDRVAIVTNSGGPGIMATDALGEHGLRLAELSPETTARLRAALSPDASVANPVDVIAGGGPKDFEAATREALADPGVDALLVIYTPPVFVDQAAVVEAILRAPRHGKPVLACILGRGEEDAAHARLAAEGVPTYTYPESAVRALAALRAHARRQAQDPGEVRAFPVDAEAARAELRAAPRDAEGWLASSDALRLVARYGVPVAPSAFATSPAEALAAARKMGGEVALKAEAEGLVHKTDAGGVRLRVPPERAGDAYEEMAGALARGGYRMRGALVQPMLGGAEVILGMTADPKFGPLLAFGLGGIHAEILKDVVFRLAPLTDADARRMVRGIRAWPLLEGFRGAPPADVAALEDALLRLSQLAVDLPEVAEVEMNPVFVHAQGKGAHAVDARVRLWPGGAPPRAPATPADLER